MGLCLPLEPDIEHPERPELEPEILQTGVVLAKNARDLGPPEHREEVGISGEKAVFQLRS
jgi:hypothetical protein